MRPSPGAADILDPLLKHGYPILYSPRPVIYHRQWRDAAEQRSLAYAYGVGIGAFCAKFGRGGDLRALRILGGSTVATVKDLAGGARRRDLDQVGVAVRTLLRLGVGAAQMALMHDA